jgi:UDP-glucose 4-epimerase
VLENSHILITGANGFLGRHLSTSLLARGAKVTQIIRSMTSAVNEKSSQIVFDLTDSGKVADVFSALQPDYVIHLAGLKDRSSTGAQFRIVYETNLSISLNVIEACLELRHFKRLVFPGTCDEYGKAPSPFDETQREMPENVYGLSKLAVTKMLMGLYQSRQFPSVILRPTIAYGPNQGDDMFLSALIQSLLAQKDFAMTHGDQFRDFVYVNDVVDAIIKAINAGDQVNGSVVNIGAGVSCQVKKVAMLVANLIHPDAYKLLKFGAVQYRPTEAMDYGVNIKRAEQLLGWQPNTLLEQGLQKTVSHFRAKVDTGKTVGDVHA